MNILKAEGRQFPELKEADAMFSADTAPDWADGEVCHRCRTEFTMLTRKHHCRNCGQVFCHQCSSKLSTVPKYGIEKEVRVCDGCFVHLQKPVLTKKNTEEDELPVEYLTSSLAQQNQTPAKKTEREIEEEEQLQLALALSQSEAEAQKPKAATFTTRTYPKAASPERTIVRSPSPVDEQPTDPELARYLNRNYWEQRKTVESPASPSAPSPSITSTNSSVITLLKTAPDDNEINDFAGIMKSQVEIFVNRMKSNSSRGRSISNDSSVQTLFMNLTSLHSKLLTYIKEMDDKRMWYEQLQDKLTQIKDSRAALDVLRQEHQEKLRRVAEEQERQRQMQMAHKLEIMRKKKQEYLQYQRQLALQRIQEQEREMQMRQEQQKAQYRMGSQNNFPFMQVMPNQPQQGSPNHMGNYGYNNQMPGPQNFGNFNGQGQPQFLPNMYGAPQNQGQNMQMPPGQYIGPGAPPGGLPNSNMVPAQGMNLPNMGNNMLPGQMAPPGSNPLAGQIPQGVMGSQVQYQQGGIQNNNVPNQQLPINNMQNMNNPSAPVNQPQMQRQMQQQPPQQMQQQPPQQMHQAPQQLPSQQQQQPQQQMQHQPPSHQQMQQPQMQAFANQQQIPTQFNQQMPPGQQNQQPPFIPQVGIQQPQMQHPAPQPQHQPQQQQQQPPQPQQQSQAPPVAQPTPVQVEEPNKADVVEIAELISFD